MSRAVFIWALITGILLFTPCRIFKVNVTSFIAKEDGWQTVRRGRVIFWCNNYIVINRWSWRCSSQNFITNQNINFLSNPPTFTLNLHSPTPTEQLHKSSLCALSSPSNPRKAWCVPHSFTTLQENDKLHCLFVWEILEKQNVSDRDSTTFNNKKKIQKLKLLTHENHVCLWIICHNHSFQRLQLYSRSVQSHGVPPEGTRTTV